MSKSLSVAFMTLALTACGGGSDGPNDRDRIIPCGAASCGKESFRRAIPSASSLKIDFQGTSGSGLKARSSRALEAVSPAYLSTAAYVDAINADITAIFDDLEAIAGTAPEVEDDAMHEWREEEGALEEVLHIDSDDGNTFSLMYGVGEPGFELSADAALLTAEVQLDADGDKASFTIDIDLDAWTAALPEADAEGRIHIRAMPFAGGELEVWYDFEDVAVGGDTPASSQTTYWIFEGASGALEFLAADDDGSATAFVRWAEDGGRYDHHVAFDDPDFGTVDEIVTNCWDDTAAETFDASAVLDDQGAFEADLDGEEDSCLFGPVADHPNPGSDFEDLPGEGEWQALEDEACAADPDQC